MAPWVTYAPARARIGPRHADRPAPRSRVRERFFHKKIPDFKSIFTLLVESGLARPTFGCCCGTCSCGSGGDTGEEEKPAQFADLNVLQNCGRVFGTPYVVCEIFGAPMPPAPLRFFGASMQHLPVLQNAANSLM